jgi:RNA polymerase sigma-70 factor (ECF subfamily)
MPASAAFDASILKSPSLVTAPTTNPDETKRIVLLIEQIKRGEDAGMTELHKMFSNGVRWIIYRRLGCEECDDLMHDAFTIVVLAIKRGALRDPLCLMGYVQTVVRIQIAHAINRLVRIRQEESDTDFGRNVADSKNNPEQDYEFREQVDFMKVVLGELSSRDREILSRYYLNEETQAEICLQMGLTGTQFRLLKCRAKERFGKLGRTRMLRGALGGLARRTVM